MAFYSFRFAPGDRILTGRAEYASNWIALRQVAHRTGATIEVVPDDEHGQFDVAALQCDARRAGQARLARARADAERARQPGRGGRPRHPRGGRAAPPRRLPVGRAAPGRRRGDRLRHPLRDRPQVPARAARHRLPLRARGADRASSSRRSSTCTPPTGSPTAATRSATTHAASRTGRPTYAGKIGLGVAVDYALELGLDAIWERDPGARRAPPERARRDATASRCSTRARARARSSPSGRRPPRSRRPHGARGRARQRLGHRGGVGAARPRRTRDRRARARVGALLQHRAGSSTASSSWWRLMSRADRPLDRLALRRVGRAARVLLLPLRPPDRRRGGARARASSRAATRCSTRRAWAPSRTCCSRSRAPARASRSQTARTSARASSSGMLARLGHRVRRVRPDRPRPRRGHRLGRGAREPDADAARLGSARRATAASSSATRPSRRRSTSRRSTRGADIVLHSATKFLTGQHDALLGATVTRERARRAPEADAGERGHRRVARRSELAAPRSLDARDADAAAHRDRDRARPAARGAPRGRARALPRLQRPDLVRRRGCAGRRDGDLADRERDEPRRRSFLDGRDATAGRETASRPGCCGSRSGSRTSRLSGPTWTPALGRTAQTQNL